MSRKPLSRAPQQDSPFPLEHPSLLQLGNSIDANDRLKSRLLRHMEKKLGHAGLSTEAKHWYYRVWILQRPGHEILSEIPVNRLPNMEVGPAH